MGDEKRLRIYLQDHYAGSTGGRELFARAAVANKGTALGDLLARLHEEIRADRAALREIMEQNGINPDHLKDAGAWTLEKAGRLKLNGSLVSRSPLSTLVELEALITGVTGKLQCWRALRASEAADPARLDELIERAERQRAELERHHGEVAPRAIT
jgi:hypothetical protein